MHNMADKQNQVVGARGDKVVPVTSLVGTVLSPSRSHWDKGKKSQETAYACSQLHSEQVAEA
uniref:Uncharacterized protein n=1 Tax=Octopus bimaculoides TaxID=37653 RepID=A0A0L8GHV2_OCTBM